MQIKIEIDVKPEELRRFLGLPDVAGLQEDFINFLREKLGTAGENFNPADFVRANLSNITRTKTWRRIMEGADAVAEEQDKARRKRAPRQEPDES